MNKEEWLPAIDHKGALIEVKKLRKQLADEMQGRVDMHETHQQDNVRTNIVITELQTQLAAVRDENKRLMMVFSRPTPEDYEG